MTSADAGTGTLPPLAERLARVDEGVAEAARAAGRDPAGITRIVVTKFHPSSLVRELADLGVRDVGESRHQEASAKAAELSDLALTWHFVGQLQSKKARQVRRYARVVHALDRASVVDALAEPDERGPVDGFLEIDLSGEPGRGGADPAEAEVLAERVLATAGIRLRGVMAVAPRGAEPRPAFARLRTVSDRIRVLDPAADAISAGMSADFREAILEGATHLRIGTAITGKRPAAG